MSIAYKSNLLAHRIIIFRHTAGGQAPQAMKCIQIYYMDDFVAATSLPMTCFGVSFRLQLNVTLITISEKANSVAFIKLFSSLLLKGPYFVAAPRFQLSVAFVLSVKIGIVNMECQ